jgi:hypothetical protein
MYIGEGEEKDKARRESLENLKTILVKYESWFKQGTRLYEIAYHLNVTIEKARKVVDGEPESPMIGLLNFGAGRRQVPLEEGSFKDELLTYNKKMVHLYNQVIAELGKNPCEHEWLLEAVSSDLGGPWMDVVCAKCQSSVTLRGYGYSAKEFGNVMVKYSEKINAISEKYGRRFGPDILYRLMPRAPSDSKYFRQGPAFPDLDLRDFV